ncbi:STAS domain-containing protein [Priestia koreensis]|uniref:STAS domain-containing protein n=1 Tax=Priestia koreensis TaxID=284581 RepID=UPI00301AD8B7
MAAPTEDHSFDVQCQLVHKRILQQKERILESLSTSEKNGSQYEQEMTSLLTWRKELIEVYANIFTMSNQKGTDYINKWGREMSQLLVQTRIPLDVAVEEIRKYRSIIGDLIKDQGNQQDYSLNTFFSLISFFYDMVDQTIYAISLHYLQQHQHQLNTAETAVDELSIPVVVIQDGLGVLPLVGDIDTRRAGLLMELALQKSSDDKLKWLIIDLSGVPIIDTMVADQLFKVVSALKLLGIETMLSGIRPEIAQTMTHLGIEFASVSTFSTLQRALQHIGFNLIEGQ